MRSRTHNASKQKTPPRHAHVRQRDETFCNARKQKRQVSLTLAAFFDRVAVFMTLIRILDIAQIVLAALLVAAILLQAKGTGAGAAFGGESGAIRRTKRGIEKQLFIATIVLAILFFGIALANALI